MFSPIAAVALCCASFSPFSEPAGELGPAGPGLPGFDAPVSLPEPVAPEPVAPEPVAPASVGPPPPPGRLGDACGCEESGPDPHTAPCGPDWLPIALRRALIPQGVAGADFRPACARHDRTYAFGYRDALGRRPGRLECDREYLANLDRASLSADAPTLSRLRARANYLAVRLAGGYSFDLPPDVDPRRHALRRLAAPGGREELEAHVKLELEGFVKGELTDFAERELETFVQTELRSAIQETTDGAADLTEAIDVEALIDLRSLWD